MSQLAELTAAPRSDILPGHTLSRFPLVSIGEMEEEFARLHVAALIGGATAADPARFEDAIEAASKDIRKRPFAFGTEDFDRRALAQSSVPFLLYLSLRAKQPKITRATAASLLTDENFAKVRQALLELLGFDFDVQKKMTPSGTQSTGEVSSAPSASADSPTLQSAA